ncbi:PQQ-binding-like beta-propeller repeat protein [Pseudomonadota bacterium]
MVRSLNTLSTKIIALAAMMFGANTALAEEPNTNLELDQGALELVWTYETGKPFNIAPTVGGGKTFVIPVNGFLHAFDAKTGHLDWTYNPTDGVWDRGLSAHGDQLFVCHKGGKIAALNIADGAVQWTSDLDGINCQRPHHVDGDVVYVSTTYVGPGLPADPLTGATLFALDRHTGKLIWKLKTGDFLLQTANSRDGVVYLAGSFKDPGFKEDDGGPARYYAIDQKTGKIKWTYADEDGTPKVIIPTDKYLLFVSYQDFIQALDKNTGKLVYKRDSNNWTPGMVVDDKNVYFGSATTIVHSWVIDEKIENWKFNIPGRKFDYLLIKPVLVGDRMYFMSQQGFVYALNKHTGIQHFRYETGMNARVGLSYADGFLYMNDSKGKVYGYKIVK